jgi:hypothetical protein
MSSKDEIGFLHLPYFPADKKFLRNLVKKIDDSIAVVIDLRGNPGGAIDGLEYFTGFFESEPVTVANMVGRKKTEAMKVKPQKPNLAGPLFILVDSQSMSSSEVFARHFQRTEQAVVIGDRTPGRATAARIFNHSLGVQRATLYGAQVAVSRLVFPDGEELEGRGVIPDQMCIPSEEHLKNADDPCLRLAQALAEQAIGLKGSDLILAMAYKEIGRDEEALHALEEAAIIEAGVDKNTALMNAAKTGNAETIQALLDEGANANAKDEDGTTVLMYAAAWGVWPNVQVLLEAGADIHAKDKDGKTVLMIAEGAGHTEIVELLKKVGAKE